MSANEPVKNGCEVIYEMFHVSNCRFEMFHVLNCGFEISYLGAH